MKAFKVQSRLSNELESELRNHILEYWMAHAIDHVHGGFYGRVNWMNRPVENAPKSSILNARILWTFAAAYRVFGDPRYRSIAEYAYSYIEEKFWDHEYGGVFWMLDHTGTPIEGKKHNYAQAFAMYGLSEYYRATGDRSALDRSTEIFSLFDNYSLDGDLGGYREALDHAWNPLSDARLNDEGMIVQRSMNTQLHILEAFTNLYRVWPDTTVCERIRMLIELFIGPIYDSKNHHFFTFFDEQWKVVDTSYSYGHDIEASWLLSEAAHAINDTLLITTTDRLSGETAYSVLNEGMDTVNGGLFNLGKEGAVIDTNKQWWAQAEAIVGFFDAYQKTEHMDFLNAASQVWSFSKDKVIDRKYGDWFYRLSADGKPDLSEDKIGPWKCPYHTARACMEIMHRAENVVSPSV